MTLKCYKNYDPGTVHKVGDSRWRRVMEVGGVLQICDRWEGRSASHVWRQALLFTFEAHKHFRRKHQDLKKILNSLLWVPSLYLQNTGTELNVDFLRGSQSSVALCDNGGGKEKSNLDIHIHVDLLYWHTCSLWTFYNYSLGFQTFCDSPCSDLIAATWMPRSDLNATQRLESTQRLECQLCHAASATQRLERVSLFNL